MDEIYQDLTRKPDIRKIAERKPDLDLPGMSLLSSLTSKALGNFYCIVCARYFNSQEILDGHCQTKTHKKRCKKLATVLDGLLQFSHQPRRFLMAQTLRKFMAR